MTNLERAKTALEDFNRHNPTSAESALRTALLLLIQHIETDLALAHLEIRERVS